jgi:hypothetical protein
VAGDIGVSVTVVDLDEEMMVRQHHPEPLHELHEIQPGDEARIRHPVMARGKPEAAHEECLALPGRHRGGKDVVDSYERSYVASEQMLPQMGSAGLLHDLRLSSHASRRRGSQRIPGVVTLGVSQVLYRQLSRDDTARWVS